MKIAILSDAHGNMVYYSKVIECVMKYKTDLIIYLGDAFGYMFDGEKIIKDLKERNAIILMGNHEAMLVGKLPIDSKKNEIYKLNEQRNLLSEVTYLEIKQLKSSYRETFEGKKCLFTHGSPDDYLNGYLYETDEFVFNNKEHFDYIFMGHTHRKYIKNVGDTCYINVGSCGLPRDKGLEPSFCLYDTQDYPKIITIKVDEAIIENVYFSNIEQKVKDVLKRR